MEPMLRERAHRRGRGAHRLPRRLAAAFAAIIAIGAVLAAAACGGDDAPSKAQPTANPPTSAATAAVAATSTTAAPVVAAKETKEKLTVGGVEREAVIYVPAKLSAAKAPAVVMLHSPGTTSGPNGGANATPARARFGILLGDEADRLGFVAVFPTGTQQPGVGDAGAISCCSFNDGRPLWGTQSPPDDIAFFKALLDLLVAKYPVDADRISFTGFGPGGVMTYRVACEMADRIAAFAEVSGGHRDNTACTGAQPLPMLLMHGTANPNAPYAGGVQPANGLTIQAVPDVIEFWRKFDGCTGEPAVTALTPKTEQRRYSPCKAGSEVVLVSVQGGGFCWWGALCGAGDLADPAINTTSVVLQFLLKQTRAGR